MKPARYVSLALLLAFLLNAFAPAVALASEEPAPIPPQVETVRVVKHANGTDVTLTWTDGTSPWIVVRSETPRFATSTTILYVSTETTLMTIDDPNVLMDDKDYFYQVKDVDTELEVYNFPETGVGGSTLVINGSGFSPVASENEIIFDDETTATIVSATRHQLQAEIPAVPTSGFVTVRSPSGVSTHEALYTVSSGFVDITHLNTDAGHNLYVADRGGGGTVWRIADRVGTKTSYSVGPNPVGLPKDSAGNFYSAVSTVSASNFGSIFRIPPGGGREIFVTTGSAADPVYPRALAMDTFTAINDGFVFLLDGNTGRVRKAKPGDIQRTWLTNLSVPNNPGGLDFGLRDDGGGFQTHLYLTRGTRISDYRIDDSTGLPTLLGDFSMFTNPAQLVVDSKDKLWIADRGAGKVIRLDPSPPAMGKRFDKISGLPNVRGLTLDTDPMSNKPILYAAQPDKVFRFLSVRNTVRVRFHVMREALVHPDTGDATSELAMQARVEKDFKRAQSIFKWCEIDLINEGIDFFNDPGSTADGSVLFTDTGCPTPEEQAIINHPDENVVHVYYIGYFVFNFDGNPRHAKGIAGLAITNDCNPGLDNTAGGAAFIARFSGCVDAAGGDIACPNTNKVRRGATERTVGHELFHFLLDRYVSDGGGTNEHTGREAIYRRRLMYPISLRDAIDRTPGECENMLTNMDESEFIELF